MFVLYNLLQAIILPFLSPFLILFLLFSPKYRNRIPSRLGYGLCKKLPKENTNKKNNSTTFWVHALSVGEVTSAIPLVSGLRESYPDCTIVFSVSTRSGRLVADKTLPEIVDQIIDGPLDILPVVTRFFKKIRPSFFILVETDFWPNILNTAKKRGVPSLLVNGRISDRALEGYKKMQFFFYPMFRSFSALSMQTATDMNKIVSLGIEASKIYTLGNLKFDTKNPLQDGQTSTVHSIKQQLPNDKIIFIAGSTHPGEEEILLASYNDLKNSEPSLFLIIAPRDPKRAEEIRTLAQKYDFEVSMRSERENVHADVFILNTIGELAACYSLGDISFVGGSLVNKGGHNPIEPAIMSTPVIFGPHMEDFSEISESLIAAGGAHKVRNSQELSAILKQLIESPAARTATGLAAKQFVNNQRGVIDRHLHLIRQLT
ncbi:MAG: 3-deoxy-D-manno-octulosonic acid transferase [Desulfobulbaceae bacterium]|nr:3-deoxy-D-manno-octulosonic acid transferase [Desulfobulbaceae bacterium]